MEIAKKALHLYNSLILYIKGQGQSRNLRSGGGKVERLMVRCKTCHKPIYPERDQGWQVRKKGKVEPGYEYDYYCYQCGLAVSIEEGREYLEVGCNIFIPK